MSNNVMRQYYLFYSWQSDRRDVKKTIRNAINKAKCLLKNDGIELFIDEDTRDRAGNKEIVSEVLDKIKRCDIFLADVTPVTTLVDDKGEELPKHMPNSNVMFEYGYAQHCKGEGKIITLAKLEKGQHRQCMPFDINHNTLTTFETSSDLNKLADWIKNIIKEVDKERANTIPEYACELHFLGSDFYKPNTIQPIYKKTVYVANKQTVENSQVNSNIEKLLNPFIKINEFVQSIAKPMATIQSVKPINQKTNHSYCMVMLSFVNCGSATLDNCNLTITADNHDVVFASTNIESAFHSRFIIHSNTFVSEKQITHHVDTVNPQDISSLEPFFIHAPHDIALFHLTWGMSSRTIRIKGEIEVKVEPEYQLKYVENEAKVGEILVEDYIRIE